jgi:hypothetical protein
MRDSIVKVIKVPFSNSKPAEGFTLHATSEYVIGGEKEKKEEVKEKGEEGRDKGEEGRDKGEEVKKENDKGKGNKNNQKAAGKENKKKQEVKIEKEEKTEPAENIIISIYKK